MASNTRPAELCRRQLRSVRVGVVPVAGSPSMRTPYHVAGAVAGHVHGGLRCAETDKGAAHGQVRAIMEKQFCARAEPERGARCYDE